MPVMSITEQTRAVQARDAALRRNARADRHVRSRSGRASPQMPRKPRICFTITPTAMPDSAPRPPVARRRDRHHLLWGFVRASNASGTGDRSGVGSAPVGEHDLQANIARIADELAGKGRGELVRELADYEVTLESAVPAGARQDQLEALERVAAADANPFPDPTIGVKLTALEIISAAVADNELGEIAKRISDLVSGAWATTHPPA
jgi:hypothetical protein